MPRSIVVIGAGPAGMAAAIEAATRGCRVTMLDESLQPGGQIYRQASPALKTSEYAEPAEIKRKKTLLNEFERIRKDIDYRPGAAVYALFENREVHFSQNDRTEVLQPDAIVLATGVREWAIPFPGWTIPGVMFAGGAQAVLKSQGVVPGRRVVVAGCGPLPLVVAAQILRAGGDVKALALLNPMSAMLRRPVGLWNGRHSVLEGLRYLRSIRKAGVPRFSGHVVTRALGQEFLEGVVLARVKRDGTVVSGTEREIACDLLALNNGFTANAELAAMAGAKLRYDAAGGGWIAAADEFGRTSIDGLLVAGDCAGLRGALVAEAEGRVVGAAAAFANFDPAKIRAAVGDVLERRRRYRSFQDAVRETLRLPQALWGLVSDETIVCRCENVRFAEIREAFDGGHLTPNAVKRNARPGMGWCAGRTCLRAVGALAEFHTGVAQAETMTARPMARPVSFAALSNQKRAVS